MADVAYDFINADDKVGSEAACLLDHTLRFQCDRLAKTGVVDPVRPVAAVVKVIAGAAEEEAEVVVADDNVAITGAAHVGEVLDEEAGTADAGDAVDRQDVVGQVDVKGGGLRAGDRAVDDVELVKTANDALHPGDGVGAEAAVLLDHAL